MRLSSIFACLTLTLAGAFPLLVNRGLPQGSDIDIHYWRTYEIEDSLTHGDLLGLWAEDFYSGYGSPIFQYQSPGFYVLASLVGKLPFVDDVARMNLVWVLSIAMGVFGVFGYASRRWRTKTALVCAASFVCAPAIMFNEPIGRGSYPVSLALGCLALSLACFDRYAAEKRFGGLAALSLFGLLWSHNLTAITGTGLLMAWFIWQALFHRARMPHLRLAFVLLILSVGMSTFFWLPLVAQRGDVQLDHLYAGENLNFKNYFQPLELLLRPAALLDTGLYYQKERYSLGIASSLLATGSFILLARGLIQKRLFSRSDASLIPHPSFFWLLVAVVTVFLVMPQSRVLWDRVQAMRFFQFPPRFLNYTALALALSGGVFVYVLTRRFRHIWLLLIALLLIQGWQSVPWRWLPDYIPEATASEFFAYELRSGASGTTGTNEYLPGGVVNLPAPTSFVMDSLAQHHPALRVNQYPYPQGTRIEALDSNPLMNTFRVIAPEPMELEIFLFKFPGWTGTVDGAPVELRNSGESGFIALDVPAGEHIVTLNYELSPLRVMSIALSLLCLVLVVSWLWWQKSGVPVPTESDLDWRDATLLTVIVIGMLSIGAALMRPGVAWLESPPGEALSADHRFDAQFGDVTLSGYDWLNVDERQMRLALYWHFDAAVDLHLNSFVHVVDADGQIVAQQDKPAFASVTTLPGWSFELNHRDVYILDLPENLPAGEYRIRLGLWRCLDDVPSATCTKVERVAVSQGGQQVSDAFIFLPETLRR